MGEKDIMATLNDVLDGDLAIDLAKDFGYLAEIVSFEEDIQMQEEEVELVILATKLMPPPLR